MSDDDLVKRIKDRADWLVDAVATATQNRQFLRGEPECDWVACDAILVNAEKAIGVVAAPLLEQLEAARRDAKEAEAYAAELEARLADALERGFWAGRACGGSKADIDAALAALKGEANE